MCIAKYIGSTLIFFAGLGCLRLPVETYTTETGYRIQAFLVAPPLCVYFFIFMSNPLIERVESARGTIPFDRIRPEHFLPALEHFRKTADERLDKIRNLKEEPDFENTVIAFEQAAEELEQTASTYYVLFSAESTEGIQKIAGDVSAFLADFSSDLFLDSRLFEKIQKVRETKAGAEPYGEEGERLLDTFYKSFLRNGAALDDEKKKKLRETDQKLARLSPAFSENVLKATNDFELIITDEKELEGLPEHVIEQAKSGAEKKGKEGWLFTLQFPDFLPFITYAENRKRREEIYRAFSSRCYGGSFDNSENIRSMIALRFERAQLLGYDSHAAYMLEDRMAENPARVESFLRRLLDVSFPAAKKDHAELGEFAKLKGIEEVEAWDVRYLAEKLRQEKYNFDSEDLRPYFKLEYVMDGIFETAGKLYGLTFKEVTNVPVYHEEVKVYEVSDKDGEVGLFYTDLFPRETKKGGAWMTSFLEQGMFRGSVRRPHIGIVCNFTRPGKTRPSLLSYDEVRTLFHEFGHALHGLLSKCTFRSLAGTNVYWDFVELPSQIMENWVREKEGLDLFARHYETGERIPEDLIEKLKSAEKFRAGSDSLRQLNFAILDMAYHTRKLSDEQLEDIGEFERRVLGDTTLVKDPGGTAFSAAFSHIFAGGYSAGYYSYKWAEALDADAFEYFLEKGIFNADVAKSFRTCILEKGNTKHPAVLYRDFRGRDPDPDALLRRDGLLSAS